jgi:hypothetical protein
MRLIDVSRSVSMTRLEQMEENANKPGSDTQSQYQ